MKALFGVLLLCAACVLAQSDNPPNLAGTWADTVCHAMPGVANTFMSRVHVYEKFRASKGGSGWKGQLYGFSNKNCTFDNEVFRVDYAGLYRETGVRVELEHFWVLDFLIAKKEMEVFTQEYADYLNSDLFLDCNFNQKWEVGVVQDVTFTYCPRFTLIDTNQCPVQFNIVRRVADVIYIGESYQGRPEGFTPACTEYNRYKTYDPYSLTFQHGPAKDLSFHLVDYVTENTTEFAEEIADKFAGGASGIMVSLGLLFAGLVVLLF